METGGVFRLPVAVDPELEPVMLPRLDRNFFQDRIAGGDRQLVFIEIGIAVPEESMVHKTVFVALVTSLAPLSMRRIPRILVM